MKCLSRIFFLFVVFSLIFTGCSDGGDDISSYGSDGTGGNKSYIQGDFVPQSEVITLFNLTNQLRTGPEAYYVDVAGNNIFVRDLAELILDESLSKAARERAKEVAISFSHARPNGMDCWSLYSEQGISGACGENIAAGYSTGSETFTQWKEDGKPYSGQGHRRIMLSQTATRIGIAGFKVTDFGSVDVSKYPDHWGNTGTYYWVMVVAR